MKKIINLPKDVENIIEILNEAGFEGYAVGGCVRDSVLGRTPNDWDITTNAYPTDIKRLFRRTIDTGIKHGTVTVMIKKTGYEITTYRIDGEYKDGRHPESVSFTPNLSEDLKRRDFTINAMAYNPQTGIVDLFGGMDDIKNKIVRCVGNPHERFSEDALRLMRAVRFAASLGYTIEDDTYAAIRDLAYTLSKVSAERIQVELIKTLLSDHPEYLRVFYETGLMKVFLPELDAAFLTIQNNPHHAYDVGTHILKSVEASSKDKNLRLCMLLHDIGKPACKTTDEAGIDHFHGHPDISEKMAVRILRELKFDNATIDIVRKLVRYHDYDIIPEEKYMRRAINRIGEECFPMIFDVFSADVAAQSDYLRQNKLDKIDAQRRVYEKIVAQNDCVSLKTLTVTGKDLIKEGIMPGPGIGEILGRMLEDVIDNPEHNTKEYLLSEYVRKE